MDEKSLDWNEIPVKITASNPETANFTTDVINTYNELIHYLYFNLSEDVFLKKLMDGFYREIFIMDVGNDSNLLIVFYVQIMPDDFVMQLHRF